MAYISIRKLPKEDKSLCGICKDQFAGVVLRFVADNSIKGRIFLKICREDYNELWKRLNDSEFEEIQ